MSALGSSVINKSGKKFAPKAPARRPAAPPPSHTSARQSVDWQVQSQTPQPANTPRNVAVSPAPAPSSSISTSLLSQQVISTAPSNSSPDDGRISVSTPTRRTSGLDITAQPGRATSIPIPSRVSPAPIHTSPAAVVPWKRSLEPQRVVDNAQNVNSALSSQISPLRTSSPAPSVSNFISSGLTFVPQPPGTQHEKQLPALGAELPATPPPTQHVPEEGGQAPIGKRRRVGEAERESQADQSLVLGIESNVPIPTTETNEVTAEAPRNAEAGSTPPPVTKTKKPRSSTLARRKQQTNAAAAEKVAEPAASTSAKQKKPRKSSKSQGAGRAEGEASGPGTGSLGEDISAQPDANAVPGKAKRKYTKKNTRQNIQNAAAEIVEDAIQGSNKDPKKRGRRSKRAVTPEGADAVTIAPSETKMADLCKDSHIGRKSEREKDLEEFERAEFVRKKQRQLQEVMGQVDLDNQAGPSESAEARLERLGRGDREESVAKNVPNTIIVDGQIQIDEDSLEVDRHKEAATERVAEQLDDVDETDLTRKVNSGSWLKRDKSGGWNELLTERFYEGLRMFGTDFEMISKMFPGRTRHKIKLKFVKEEKFNQDKIKSTLLGEKLPVDLPELEKMAGVEFDDPKELEREMEEDRKRLEEETLAEKQAMDELRNKRETQIAAERAAAVGEESSAKENKRGKNKKKKGEKQKSKKGSTRRKEKNADGSRASLGPAVLGELGGSDY